MLNLPSFEENLQKLTGNFRGQKFLLALSGGADSMVLADLFSRLKVELEVAHINYHLRDEDSNADQKVVEKFCSEKNIPFHLYEVSEKDQLPQHSIQLWAREIRYQFFFDVLKKRNLDFLVTAHHLNDQLETFLINLSKASGLKGLSGIPQRTENTIRPLLPFGKNEIYQYAQSNSLEFREDLSNQKNDYLRNQIRNTVVPEVLKINENFLENFSRSLTILNDTKDFVNQNLENDFNEILEKDFKKTVLKRAKLEGRSPFVQFEILNRWNFRENEIKKILQAETGKVFFSQSHQLTADREFFIIEERNSQSVSEEIVIATTFKPEISLTEHLEKPAGKDWTFDADKVKFPLKLRKKEQGDQFFPAGMTGRKKVSKFFKDEKISILAQQKIWLLTDVQNRVLGIVPLRQDRRFIPQKATKNILKIKL